MGKFFVQAAIRGVVGGVAVAVSVALAVSAGAGPAQAIAAGSFGSNPAVVYLSSADRACSGVLVRPQWVLTAASCVPIAGKAIAGAPAAATSVVVGRGSAVAEKAFQVTEVVLRQDRNVALARLNTAVTGVSRAAVASAAPRHSDVLTAAGYGRTRNDWVTDKVSLGQFTVGEVSPTTLGVTGKDDAALCKGDAGGPAFDTSGRIVGLSSSSFQTGCYTETETRTGAALARVDDLSAWVDDYTDSCKASAAKGFAPIWDGRSPQSEGWQTAGGASTRVAGCELKIVSGDPTTKPVYWYGAENLPTAYTVRLDYRGTVNIAKANLVLGYYDSSDPADRAKWGAEVPLEPATPTAGQLPAGAWNTLEVTVAGKTVHVWRNGTKVNQFDNDKILATAFLALRGAAVGTPVTVRNVQLRVNENPATFGALTGIGGKCTDVPFARVDTGTPLNLFSCHGGPNQQFTAAPDGSLHVLSRCVDENGPWSEFGGSKAQLAECTGGQSQKFDVDLEGRIHSATSGRCLDAPGDKDLYFQGCFTPGENQKWKLPTEKVRFGPIHGFNTTCVDVESANRSDGTAINLIGCHNSEAQTFTLAADGTIRVLGRCLDVGGPEWNWGRLLHLWGCNGSAAQRFEHRANNTLYNAALDKCVDAPGSGPVRLYMFGCHDGVNQKFSVPAQGSGTTGADALKPVTVRNPGAPVADPSPVTHGTANIEDFGYPGAAGILAEHQLKLFKGDGHILFDSKRTYAQGQCPTGLTQVEKTLDVEPYGLYYCFRTIGSKGNLTLEVPNTFGVRGGTEDLLVTAKLPDGTVLEPTPVKPNQPVAIEPGDGNELPQAILVEIRMN